MRPEKLAKLAAIFSIWNQPDSAAEILIAMREKLQGMFDVDVGLELLTGQAQPDSAYALPYKAYIAAFEAGAPQFSPAPWVPPMHPTILTRLKAAYRGLVNPNSVSDSY